MAQNTSTSAKAGNVDAIAWEELLHLENTYHNNCSKGRNYSGPGSGAIAILSILLPLERGQKPNEPGQNLA